MPGVGRCATTMDDEQDDVILRCAAPGRHAGCHTVFLENVANGHRNPEQFFCRADYAPYALSIDPNVIGRSGVGLPFRDLDGLAHYPVDGNQLARAQVVMRTYRPVEHFTRRVVVSQIKLEGWTPQKLTKDEGQSRQEWLLAPISAVPGGTLSFWCFYPAVPAGLFSVAPSGAFCRGVL